MNLIVSTLSKDDKKNLSIIEKISLDDDYEVIYSSDLDIKSCIGCNRCWLVTPGICVLKDDYEKLFIKFLQAKKIVFITELKYGFVSYKLKNIIDRLIPFATMNLKFKNGQMRHYSRYDKVLRMRLIYLGKGNEDFLDKWFSRVMLNLNGISLGTKKGESYL